MSNIQSGVTGARMSGGRRLVDTAVRGLMRLPKTPLDVTFETGIPVPMRDGTVQLNDAVYQQEKSA